MSRRLLIPAVTAAAVAAVLAACDRTPTAAHDPSTPAEFNTAGHGAHVMSNVQLDAEDLKVIAQLRAKLPLYHNVAAAIDSGYTTQFPKGCAQSPAGAQGYHFLNTSKLDATIDPLSPELLMYERNRDGRLQLVGVDYVIPYDVIPADADPKPTVLGVPMMNNDGLRVWALHIWAPRANPTGIMQAWNPNVSCRYQDGFTLPAGASYLE